MKKIFLSILTALLCTVSYAQNPDAVFKLLRQEWTVNADGTSDYHYRHEVQILRNRALVAYADKGETFVVYNPDFEEVTVNEVYTLQKDGTRVDMPQNAFIYQLPSECADCGRFNHMRELAMVHTGMEIGCTVVVDYTIHRRYSLLNQTLTLVRECPIERLEINVRVPADQELGATLVNPEYLSFHPTVEQTATSYSLHAVNVPQNYVDSYLPAPQTIYPTLHFYNGVPEYLPAFDNRGLPAAEDAAMQQLNSSDPRENAVTLRDFVVDNIHLNDISPEHLGYTHATAAEVWQTGCGTATDKAVLLASLLNQVGYTARVIGDACDEVGIMVDTLEYRLGVRAKTPIALNGEARDEVKAVSDKRTVDAVLDTLGDGFFRMVLPAVKGSPSLRVSQLALTRVAPLQGTACDIQSDVTYLLPKGVKLVGGSIDRSLSHEGIGQVKVSVKQSGNKLRVVRSLKLAPTIVQAKDYADYRALLVMWQGVEPLLFRAK